MITFLIGENDYELTKKVAQLKIGFNGVAERFDAAELTREQLADIFAGQSLFAMKRMVIIDNPSVNTDLWNTISDWSDRLNSDTQLILIEPKPDKRTSAYKWLKKNTDVQEFPALDERNYRGISSWLETYAKAQDVRLTTQQLRRLIDRVGPNQWELAHGIDKLALANEVTDAWIDDVTQASPTENVFALFETVLNNDTERLRSMVQTLRLTEDPYRILGLMNSQALQLAVLTYGEGDIAKVVADSGASSAYPFQKLAPFAVRLSKLQVRDMIGLLADADVRLKSSDADPWVVLENTLTRIASL